MKFSELKKKTIQHLLQYRKDLMQDLEDMETNPIFTHEDKRNINDQIKDIELCVKTMHRFEDA